VALQLPPALEARIRAAGQAAVLRFWPRLDEPAQRSFLSQLETVDWAAIPGLVALVADRRSGHQTATAIAGDLATARTPPVLSLETDPTAEAAAERGRAALAAGRIGAILVAGGQGTRLGSSAPKGVYPVGPVSGRSLFELLLGRLVAIRRRYGRDVPLAIMTSSSTDAETRSYLKSHGWCGLDSERVLIFRQQDLPTVDAATGAMLLDGPGRLAVAPDGHGGMLTALASRGGLDWFARQGVEHVASFQVDNPLAMPLDPRFLGQHLHGRADFSTQVIRKREPGERVGVVVESGGRYRVVEYSDLPAAVAAERLPEGRLRFDAGSIAVHAFALDFLSRAAAEGLLPLHLALKAVPFVDATGTRVVPSAPNAIKFERFIFDLMPFAERVCVVEIDAADGFAPLKNPPGAAADAIEHVQAALVAFARRTLATAGVKVADGVPVELDPASILDAADVARSVPPGTTLTQPTLVGR
jgi:UDP-N-acetylglucosamine/UDP-N-acetylgalactosamine diphosphorylase